MFSEYYTLDYTFADIFLLMCTSFQMGVSEPTRNCSKRAVEASASNRPTKKKKNSSSSSAKKLVPTSGGASCGNR